VQSNKIAYLFAGASIGGTLAVLFAPKPGAQTRQRLRALGARGRDAFEHRGEILQAGRDRVSEAIDAGREAYRETTSDPRAPAGLGALGLLALETAAVVAGYKLIREVRNNTLVPKLETFLDASRSVLAQGSHEISAIASKTQRILSAFESAVESRLGNE
jgi:hypothetical protein